MSLIRKHGAVLQAWACLALVLLAVQFMMQIKFNFIFYGVCHSLAACQRHTPSSLATVIGRCPL